MRRLPKVTIYGPLLRACEAIFVQRFSSTWTSNALATRLYCLYKIKTNIKIRMQSRQWYAVTYAQCTYTLLWPNGIQCNPVDCVDGHSRSVKYLTCHRWIAKSVVIHCTLPQCTYTAHRIEGQWLQIALSWKTFQRPLRCSRVHALDCSMYWKSIWNIFRINFKINEIIQLNLYSQVIEEAYVRVYYGSGSHS